jgi:Cu-Zn family superoxide dismutase
MIAEGAIGDHRMLERRSVRLLAATAALLASCANPGAKSVASAGAAARQVVAATTLLAADGSTKGNATLSAAGDGLELRIEAAELPAGQHGLHLHTAGRCDAPDFASAGPHLNPHAKQHGTGNPQGSHLGDLPNIALGADGKGSLTVPLAGPRADVEPILFDADGTAIVIHAGPDDNRTDPSGNSGARIACGVLTRS